MGGFFLKFIGNPIHTSYSIIFFLQNSGIFCVSESLGNSLCEHCDDTWICDYVFSGTAVFVSCRDRHICVV